jgi:hypothetical protein
MAGVSKINISENTLRNRGRVLAILLSDRTRHKPSRPHNIVWATDSYLKQGKEYAPTKQIKREQITGLNGKLIQPRAAKSKEEQKYRTKDKAEVFTPLKVVKKMNMAIDWSSKNWPVGQENWIDYISELRLEITCGEAPFIAGRYNPTAYTGVVITPKNRVGFLDRKLQVVGEFTGSKKKWLEYAEVALKATYGYEWQGDNLLIARENILQTTDEFYKDFCTNNLKLKTTQSLSDGQLEHFAEIISWNIWQMDGLKYVIPMSCRRAIQKTPEVSREQLSLSLVLSEKPRKIHLECEGCRMNNPLHHSGRYTKIMDWATGKRIKFVDLLTEGALHVEIS